jgi:hypothetical protein
MRNPNQTNRLLNSQIMVQMLMRCVLAKKARNYIQVTERELLKYGSQEQPQKY